jgi:hypothetical protein
MTTFTTKLCDREKDLSAVTDMLFALKDDLCLSNREAAQRIVELCFEKGGVFGVYDGDLLCGMAGFFCGEPDRDFGNKEIAFLYVAGILPQYRLSRVFLRGLIFALQTVEARGFQEIRLQARATDPYTNKLYERFAHKVAEGKSLRGDPVITYGGTIEEGLARLQRRRPFCQSADELLTPVH